MLDGDADSRGTMGSGGAVWAGATDVGGVVCTRVASEDGSLSAEVFSVTNGVETSGSSIWDVLVAVGVDERSIIGGEGTDCDGLGVVVGLDLEDRKPVTLSA